MKKLRVGIIDLVTKGPTSALYARVMNANLASIMPQVVGVWCEARGHEVTYVCYTGLENLVDELPGDGNVCVHEAYASDRAPSRHGSDGVAPRGHRAPASAPRGHRAPGESP